MGEQDIENKQPLLEEEDVDKDKLRDSNENLSKVLYISTAFFILFSAYNGAQSLMSQIYEQLGYKQLGRQSLVALYFTFLVNNLFAANIIQNWSYKKGLFIGSFGYIGSLLTGLFTTWCAGDQTGICTNEPFIYFINFFGSGLNGFCAPILWLSHAKYITTCSNQYNRGKFFGYFWGMMNFNMIMGNIIALYVIHAFSQLTFYVVMSTLACAASIMILFAPSVEKTGVDKPKTVSQKIQDMKNLATGDRMPYFIPFLIFNGLVVAEYIGFESQVLQSILVGREKKEINEYTAAVFIFQGVIAVIIGFFTGKLADKVQDRTLLMNSSLLCVVGAEIVSLLAYHLANVGLGYVMGFFWGLGFSAVHTLAAVVISKDYGGLIESFALMQFFTEIGVIIGLVISILFASQITTAICIVYFFTVITQSVSRAYKSKVL